MESLSHPVLLRANRSLVFAVVGIGIAWLGIGFVLSFEADLPLAVGPCIAVCGLLALAASPIDRRFRLLMIGTIASVVTAWALIPLDLATSFLDGPTPYHRFFLLIYSFIGLNWLAGLLFCRAMLHLAHVGKLETTEHMWRLAFRAVLASPAIYMGLVILGNVAGNGLGDTAQSLGVFAVFSLISTPVVFILLATNSTIRAIRRTTGRTFPPGHRLFG